MSRPFWHRSLYWRIALGLCAFLALMLAAQGLMFLWMTDRIAASMPASSPGRFAALVASDVGASLRGDTNLDLAQYLSEQYGETLQAFVVILDDGRTFSNHNDVPVELLAALRAEQLFMRRLPSLPPPGFARPPLDRSLAELDENRPPAAARLPPRPGEFAPILVGGMPVGRVIVLPGGSSYWRILTKFGPTMAPIAAGVLGVGMVLTAFVVFGSARRRLKAIQEATERLGAGDLDARAPDLGRDEIASLARAFNNMAEQLTLRARALTASDNARRQLLADVSHELMTPLTAVRGYVEILGRPQGEIDQSTRNHHIHIVIEETRRLESITEDLLDLARLEGAQ